MIQSELKTRLDFVHGLLETAIAITDDIADLPIYDGLVTWGESKQLKLIEAEKQLKEILERFNV